jgi:hypothetical protein
MLFLSLYEVLIFLDVDRQILGKLKPCQPLFAVPRSLFAVTLPKSSDKTGFWAVA